ncbi:MAG: hypothetical protein ABI183_15910 [Polyangiaceae bacterium]
MSEKTEAAVTDKYEVAFDKTKAQRDALSPDALAPRNIDLAFAVSVVLNSLEALQAFRPQIAATFRTFDLAQFDQLEQYAYATFHAQGLSASTPEQGGVNDLYEASLGLREILTSDLNALIRRKLLDDKALSDVSNLAGYKNVAVDVMTLSTIARNHWASISNKTALTKEEVEQARETAGKLLVLSTSRDKVDMGADTKQRALTLMVNAYDNARAAIAYVQRGTDVMLPPSLYNRSSSRRKSDPVTTGSTPIPPATAPTAPVATIPVIAPAAPPVAPATTATAPAATPASPSSDTQLTVEKATTKVA